MTNLIASSTQVTVPVKSFASDTAGSLVSNSQDLELSDIKAKLNSVCEDIELLKLNFESFKRSTDLSTKSGPIEALEREKSALKAKLKEAEAERDSLELRFLAKDLTVLTCNQNSTEKRDQNTRQTTEEALWELVEVKKKKNTQDSHLKEKAAKNTKKMRWSMATPKPQPQPSSDANSDQMNNKKPVVVIAGDSLIKNVQG